MLPVTDARGGVRACDGWHPATHAYVDRLNYHRTKTKKQIGVLWVYRYAIRGGVRRARNPMCARVTLSPGLFELFIDGKEDGLPDSGRLGGLVLGGGRGRWCSCCNGRAACGRPVTSLTVRASSWRATSTPTGCASIATASGALPPGHRTRQHRQRVDPAESCAARTSVPTTSFVKPGPEGGGGGRRRAVGGANGSGTRIGVGLLNDRARRPKHVGKNSSVVIINKTLLFMSSSAARRASGVSDTSTSVWRE